MLNIFMIIKTKALAAVIQINIVTHTEDLIKACLKKE